MSNVGKYMWYLDDDEPYDGMCEIFDTKEECVKDAKSHACVGDIINIDKITEEFDFRKFAQDLYDEVNDAIIEFASEAMVNDTLVDKLEALLKEETELPVKTETVEQIEIKEE